MSSSMGGGGVNERARLNWVSREKGKSDRYQNGGQAGADGEGGAAVLLLLRCRPEGVRKLALCRLAELSQETARLGLG